MREKRIWKNYLTKFAARLEGGRLENLKHIISKKERLMRKHFGRRLVKARVNSRNFKNTLINLLAYSVFDTYYWKLKQKGSSTTIEFRKFRNTIRNLNDYLDEDLIYYSLKDECRYLSKLSRGEVEKIIMTLKYLAEVISRMKKRSLIHMANKLREYVMFNVSRDLSESAFRRKAHYFGLLTSNKIADMTSAIEAIRLSISCLPKGGQYVANLFLYLATKVLKLWRVDVKSLLHSPLDNGISEVCLSLGLTDKRLENFNYLSLHYEVFQRISEILFPSDPSKMFTLRAIAERWCYNKDWKLCEQCWLTKICPREY